MSTTLISIRIPLVAAVFVIFRCCCFCCDHYSSHTSDLEFIRPRGVTSTLHGLSLHPPIHQSTKACFIPGAGPPGPRANGPTRRRLTGGEPGARALAVEVIPGELLLYPSPPSSPAGRQLTDGVAPGARHIACFCHADGELEGGGKGDFGTTYLLSSSHLSGPSVARAFLCVQMVQGRCTGHYCICPH